MAVTTKPVQLDDDSEAIIGQLQTDGRRTYAEIGKTIGLSEAAVRQRVQKHTDSGVIQIVAITDPVQLGFHHQAMIGMLVGAGTPVIATRSRPSRAWITLCALPARSSASHSTNSCTTGEPERTVHHVIR